MASGKRASMREGPLAALFRKTEEAAQDAEAAGQAADSGAREPRTTRSGPLTTARHEEPAAEPPAGAGEQPGAPAEEPPARADAPPPSTAAAQRARTHPSLHDVSPAEEEPQRRVPSPQERLRHAFSADIPENILDRAPARRAAADPIPTRPRAGTTSPPAGIVPARSAIPCCASSASAAPASTRSTAWSRPRFAGVEFVAINTDLQSLQQSTADVDAAHRPAPDARAGRRLGPRPRPPGGDGGVRPHQVDCSRARTWSSSPPAPVAAPAPARRRSSRASRARSAR